MTRRTAGSRWRLLVHDAKGRTLTKARHFSSYPMRNLSPALSERVTLEDTEFDEIVVGRWLHVEAMDAADYWMNIGGVTLLVTADRDGHPKKVSVYMPGTYADPVDGCKYALDFNDPYDTEGT
jgi:hypothetical protein